MNIYLRIHRLARGLSQNDVAEKLGLADARSISRWENGSGYPDMTNAVKLSEIYRVDLETLFPELRQKARDDLRDHEKKQKPQPE